MTMPLWPLGRGVPDIGPDVDGVCLVFSREETERLRVGRSVDDLMVLTDDPRLRRQLAHGLYFVFDGWDNDPREVMLIPECRQYLRQLHAHWPYWLHFMAPIPDLWSVLLLCLTDSVQVAGAEGGKMKLTVNPGEIRRLLEAMLVPLNLLHDDMGLSELQRREIFERSMGAIEAVMA